MSSIKPPAGSTPNQGTSGLGRAESAEKSGVNEAGQSFGEAVEGAKQAQQAEQSAAVQQAGQAQRGDALAELAKALDTGELGKEEALSRLLEQSVGDIALSAADRSELLGALRAALETDPALAELKDRLGS